MTSPTHHRKRASALAALTLVVTSHVAQAQDTAAVDTLRQTTRNLIDALVDSKVLTREKADELLRAAEAQAKSTPAEPIVKANEPAAEKTADGRPVLRVPYVPDTVRARIRDEIKQEVINQARAERWGVPNAVPGWADRLTISGDLRVRHQVDSPDSSNTPAQTYLVSELNDITGLSRAPDFAAYRLLPDNSAQTINDTQESRERERIRLRLDLSMKVNDYASVGVRMSTGSVTDRVSTNQTMGQNFNKYQVFLDRAFVRLSPIDAQNSPWGLDVTMGRIPNPWFSTEMTWSDNLNFEGYAATLRYINPDNQNAIRPFVTLGYFPLRENSPPSRDSRALLGAQLGADWQINSLTRLKLGLAYYQYKNLEGRSDTDYENGTDTGGRPALLPGATYGQSEYPVGLRQKGNTVFETNPVSEAYDTAPIWGLAYKFKPLVLTAAAEFRHFSPFNVMLSGEYARNTAFDKADFQLRATDPAYDGVDPGGRDDAFQLKVAVGDLQVVDPHDWQIMASYRQVGSDALLDAFTDSDLGLGGTNLRGYTLGATYGIFRNSTLGLRYMAAENLDTTLNSNAPDASYKVNSLQVDFNVRF